MKSHLLKWLFTIAAVLLTGCATQRPMALADAAAPKSDKVTVLMTTTIQNQYKTGYQPDLFVVHVEKAGAKEKADRLNFRPDETAVLGKDGEAGQRKYLLSFELDPGKHVLVALSAMVRSFPFVGTFQTRLMQDWSFDQAGVYYAGHVEAVVRERKDDEERAGPVIPLIDQAVTGASGGTFDINISDQWATDEATFRTRFPALNAAKVEKKLLAPHDKIAVKARWDDLQKADSAR